VSLRISNPLPYHPAHSPLFGGSGEIRTHGPFRIVCFQDRCIKPGSATLPLNIHVKKILSVLLWLPSAVWAWSDWTREQQNWFVAANAAMLGDWATTRNMTRRYSEGYWERNLILGRHPTAQRVDLHFATAMIANYFIADYFQGRNRTLYLQVVTGVESVMILNNLSIGLRLEF
jgi:hypothetical protein